MKFLSTLVIVIIVQLINGPHQSESILKPLIKLRPKIVLGKGRYDDDALGLYRILGRTFVGLYLLGAVHKPYGGLYGGYQSPFSVTFSVGKKVEAGKSGSKHRHHRYHDDEDEDEDDHDHHHHHHRRYKGESKSKYSDDSDGKSVKHIVVSHKFVDKPASMDSLMMSEMVEGSTGPIVQAVTDSWSAASSAESASYRSPSSGMSSMGDFSSPLSSHPSSSSSSSSSYSSSSAPVASIIRGRKVYSSGDKSFRSKVSGEVDSREEDVESGGEEDDYDDSEDQRNVPMNVRTQSKIYSHRDETIDEPKGFKYGYSKPQYTDFMKSSESSERQTIHQQEVVDDKDSDSHSKPDNSTEHNLKVSNQPEDSLINDELVPITSSPLPNVTTISDLPLNMTVTSQLNVSESIEASNATVQMVPPTESPQTEDTTIVGDTFLEEIRKIENSLMVQKTEALGRLRIEKELASSASSKVPKDEVNLDLIISTPIHEEGESVEKKIVHRRRKNRRKNRKGRRKNKNSGNNLNTKSRQRRRKNNIKKNRSNRRVPVRKNLKIADSYPIILPPGSRPYLPAITNINSNNKKIKNRSHQFIFNNKSPILPIESLYYPSPLSIIH